MIWDGNEDEPWKELCFRFTFLFHHQRTFLYVLLVSYVSIAAVFSVALGGRILQCFDAEYIAGEGSFGDVYYLQKFEPESLKHSMLSQDNCLQSVMLSMLFQRFRNI